MQLTLIELQGPYLHIQNSQGLHKYTNAIPILKLSWFSFSCSIHNFHFKCSQTISDKSYNSKPCNVGTSQFKNTCCSLSVNIQWSLAQTLRSVNPGEGYSSAFLQIQCSSLELLPLNSLKEGQKDGGGQCCPLAIRVSKCCPCRILVLEITVTKRPHAVYILLS